MCLTDVSSKLSGAPDFCLSLAHGSCLYRFLGMGLREGVSETPATSFRDPVSPAYGLHLAGVDSVMGRNDQRCVLTDTVLGAVARVLGRREQDVAGGTANGLMGPGRSVGVAWR